MLWGVGAGVEGGVGTVGVMSGTTVEAAAGGEGLAAGVKGEGLLGRAVPHAATRTAIVTQTRGERLGEARIEHPSGTPRVYLRR